MTNKSTIRRKPKRKTLINKADKLFSLKVREIGICQLQGVDKINCGGNLQCAHIIGRAHKALRWDLRNALSLCAGHHYYYTNNPTLWALTIAKFFPGTWDYLVGKQADIWDKDLDRVLEELK